VDASAITVCCSEPAAAVMGTRSLGMLLACVGVLAVTVTALTGTPTHVGRDRTGLPRKGNNSKMRACLPHLCEPWPECGIPHCEPWPDCTDTPTSHCMPWPLSSCNVIAVNILSTDPGRNVPRRTSTWINLLRTRFPSAPILYASFQNLPSKQECRQQMYQPSPHATVLSLPRSPDGHTTVLCWILPR